MLPSSLSTRRPSGGEPPRSLFPEAARAIFSDGSEEPPPLFPLEYDAIRNAVATRQREFALGRWCARRALAALGIPAHAIPVGQRRAPSWPRGTVGSITHCKGFVGAVVAPANQLQAIGFDAERADALDPDLIRLICTPAELEWIRLRRHGNPADWVDGVDWPKAFFSAKEAIHKCIWPLWDRMLDFLDVTIEMDPDRQTFSAHESRPGAAAGIDFEQMRGRVAATERFVFTCAFVESLPQPPAPQSPA